MPGSIRCRDLELKREGRFILGPLDLEIPNGSKIAVVGPNGAGKSTLLKCLIRIHSDYGGSIHLGDVNLKQLTQNQLARQIAYVPQGLAPPPGYTVEAFVALGRFPYLGPFTPMSAQDRNLVKQIMEKLEVDHLANRSLNTLSGGERQRVYIASALAQEPRILLLDEPLTFLDPPHQVSGAQLLLNLHRESDMTIMLVTHELAPAVLHDYHILAMNQGHVFFFGPSWEFMEDRIPDQLFQIPFQPLPYPQSNRAIPFPWRPL